MNVTVAVRAMTFSRTIAAVAVACLWLACQRESPRAAAPSEGPSQPVETALVERVGDGGSTSVPATVLARERARLAARIPSSVVALPVREGDRVQRGALLVRLDDAALVASLRAAEAASRAASSDLARVDVLLQAGAATPRDAEDSRTRVAAAAAAVSSATETLAWAVLRAPFDGTVASRPANVGDVVTPGTTLIEIEGIGGLELRATLEADLVSKLRPGSTLDVMVDGQAAPLVAVVRALSAAGDPATHRFELKADLPAAPGLRSGLFARLIVPAHGESPRLIVPQSAVLERGGLTGVVVLDGAIARLRWVAVGATAGGRTEIRAGVEAGQRVVLDPRGIPDGARVVDTSAPAR
jgi:membrane fusion protein, multidrug efflux system